jgi:pyruvate/2-oxoglutarate dehydrogenase complex dihydrolipoamide acyltransferase (E2) component
MSAMVLLMAVFMADGGAKAAAPAAATKTAPAAPTAATKMAPAAPAAKSEAAPAAAKTTAAPGKLAPEVSKQMTESIIAVNKALGLESWPSHGATPCVDRGGQGITSKDVTADETRKCAMTALDKKFSELGKSFVLAIPMVQLGPVTVIALGLGDNADWGAYSCDPQRKCNPVKLSAPSKWGKRMADRKAKACSETTTLWFPADQKACGAPSTAAK